MSAPNNNNRITELMVAASRGDLSRAEALLRDEWTALMIAALNNRPPVVAALLRRGAYPDAQNATGWTALMLAERGTRRSRACSGPAGWRSRCPRSSSSRPPTGRAGRKLTSRTSRTTSRTSLAGARLPERDEETEF